MITHEGVLYSWSLAKYAAAFFRMSRCCVMRFRSAFRRAFSAAAPLIELHLNAIWRLTKAGKSIVEKYTATRPMLCQVGKMRWLNGIKMDESIKTCCKVVASYFLFFVLRSLKH
jgi:hypothetical protein